MKKLIYLLSLLVILWSCDSDVTPIIYPTDNSEVLVLNVDYTTHNFLGGYSMPLQDNTDELDLHCVYNPAGDFGDILWYDKASDTRLFAGTITWMGKGERTFPKEISRPEAFPKMKNTARIPSYFQYLLSDEFTKEPEDMDYNIIWASVENLQCVSWVNKDTQAYIYLYAPSVGDGDPKDWYWIIFLKY